MPPLTVRTTPGVQGSSSCSNARFGGRVCRTRLIDFERARNVERCTARNEIFFPAYFGAGLISFFLLTSSKMDTASREYDCYHPFTVIFSAFRTLRNAVPVRNHVDLFEHFTIVLRP